jgi:hypothetical protein
MRAVIAREDDGRHLRGWRGRLRPGAAARGEGEHDDQEERDDDTGADEHPAAPYRRLTSETASQAASAVRVGGGSFS